MNFFNKILRKTLINSTKFNYYNSTIKNQNSTYKYNSVEEILKGRKICQEPALWKRQKRILKKKRKKNYAQVTILALVKSKKSQLNQNNKIKK